MINTITSSKYFDLCIALIIGLNVVTMALEFYLMPKVGLEVGEIVFGWLVEGWGLWKAGKGGKAVLKGVEVVLEG